MAFIILGIITLLASFIVGSNNTLQRYGKILRGLAFLLMILGVLLKSVVQIDAGQIGVK